MDEKGKRGQRAEVRFDEISGCLRTPVGGSSRQTILIVEGEKVRSRLLSPREAARLMGLPDSYKLPQELQRGLSSRRRRRRRSRGSLPCGEHSGTACSQASRNTEKEAA